MEEFLFFIGLAMIMATMLNAWAALRYERLSQRLRKILHEKDLDQNEKGKVYYPRAVNRQQRRHNGLWGRLSRLTQSSKKVI
jgi:hypothetical protein